MSTDSAILINTEGGVQTITLNRPEVFNSFNQSMGRAFQAALDEAAADESVRCVVITGAGKAFCAGQDLKEVTAPDAPDFTVIVEQTYNESIRRIRSMEKPVIGAVNGVAAGAGANIALACDLTIAKQSAPFIQAFSKIGLIPDSGGTWMLPRLIGMQRAAALTFFGDKLPAEQAVAMGLIYSAVPDEEFETAVTELAKRLAAMPTRGLGLTKKAFNLGWENELSAHLTLERDLQMEASQTADYAEGVAAFLEKRKPSFTGK
jgi:2-(1,2-epoxy-1,2-dihydrophenyl)acetyl-CoA isomerase